MAWTGFRCLYFYSAKLFGLHFFLEKYLPNLVYPMFSIITTSKTPEMVNYNLSPAIRAIAGGKKNETKESVLGFSWKTGSLCKIKPIIAI